MGLQDIGLEAVFENAAFIKGMSEYMTALKGGEDKTTAASQVMTTKLANVGGAIVMGALAGVTAAIGAMTGAIITGIPLASDLSETVSKVGVVFANTSPDILAWGEAAATALGMSTNEALAAAATYGNLFRSMGITEDASADMSTGLVELAADLASFNNMDPTLVLEKLRAGLTGETEPLKTLGVNLSAASIEAKAMAMGLAQGKDELTASAKAQAAYALILEQTALAQGDFARTSEGLANQERIAAAQVKNARTELGKLGLSLKTRVYASFNDALALIIPHMKKWVAQMEDTSTPIGKMVQGVTDFVNGVISSIPKVIHTFGQIVDFFRANQPLIVGALSAIAVAVGVWAYTTITAAIPAIVAMVTASAPLIAVLLLIAGVVAAVGYAWENNFLGMRDTLTEFWSNSVQPALEDLREWLANNIPAAIETLKGFWENTLLPAIQTVWDWIQTNLFPLFQTMWDWLETKVPAAIETLKDVWENTLLPSLKKVWEWMKSTLFPFLESVANFLDAVFTKAVEALSKAWEETLLPGLEKVWAFVNDKLLPALQEFGKWLSETFDPIIRGVGQLVRDILAGAFEWASQKLRELTEWFNTLAALINGTTGGGKGGGNCFTGDTPVNTPSGPRSIRKLEVGDWVVVLTEDGPEEAQVEKVIQSVRTDLVRVMTSDGQVFHCSPNHRWKVRGRGWVHAEDLCGGDALYALEDEVFVETVENYQGVYPVYNIEVDHVDHTYLVGGLVVHNAKPSEGPGYSGPGAPGPGASSSGSWNPPVTPSASNTNVSNTFNMGGNNIYNSMDAAMFETQVRQAVVNALKNG